MNQKILQSKEFAKAAMKRVFCHPHIKKITTHIWRNRIAWGIMTVVIFATSISYFYTRSPQSALSATFYFTQSDWSGGVSATAGVHPTDASNWNKYTSTSSVFAGSDLVVTSSIGLNAAAASLGYRVDATQNWGGHAYNPKIAVNTTTGDLYVVYYSREYNASYDNIALRKSTDGGVTWGSRVDVTANTARSSVNPSIALDYSGNIHVAYQSLEYNATYYNIAYRKSTDSGVSFGSRVDATSNTDAHSYVPVIAISTDSSGDVNIVYYSKEANSSHDNIAFRKSTNGGASFGSRVNVTANTTVCSREPSMSIDPAGNIHIAYHSWEQSTVDEGGAGAFKAIAYRKSTNGGTSFSGVTNVTSWTVCNSSRHCQYPSIVATSTNNVYIAYYSQEYSNGYDYIALRRSVDGGSTWSDRIDVDVSSGNSYRRQPQITAGPSNTLYVTYRYGWVAGTHYIGFRKSTNDGVTWGSNVDASGSLGATPAPSIAVDSSGNPHVAYYSLEYNSSYYNIANKNSTDGGTSFGSRVDLTTIRSRAAAYPQIVINTSTGVMYSVYQSYEYYAGIYNIAMRTSTDGGVTWGARRDITTMTSGGVDSGSYPSVAIDSSGNVHVVYPSKEYNANYNNIAYRKSTDGGLTWSARVDVTTLSSTAGGRAQSFIIDSSNNLYILYLGREYNGNDNLSYRKSSDGGTTWSVRKDVTTSTAGITSFGGEIAINSSGNLHVVYSSNEATSRSNVAYRKSIDGGNTWSGRMDITTSTSKDSKFPKIAIDSTDNLHVVYHSNFVSSYNDISYNKSTDGGVTWSARTDITAASSANYPKIIAGSAGNIHVVYYSLEVNGTYTNIAYRSSNNGGSSWSSRVDITTSTSYSSTYPALAVDSSNRVNIVYQSPILSAATGDNISFNRYTPSLYYTGGNLISSAYDSGSDSNLIGGLSWSEGGASATYATTTISLRVASTQGGLSTAQWVDWTYASSSCSKSGGAVTCALASVPAWMRDGTNDRWLQYKVNLGSLGGTTNYVDNISITYIVNAPPSVQNVTATQGADGLVTITYEAKDEDTTSGSAGNANYVTTTFEYWNGSTYVPITTIAGASTYSGSAFKHNPVVEGSYTAYSVIWTPTTTDFTNQYYGAAKIRVTVNDGEAANYTASSTSATFVLDTKSATPSSIIIDATSTLGLAYLTATDDSAMYMKVSLNSDLAGADWEAFASSKQISTALTDPDTVYAQFKDAYGNTTAIVSATTITTPLSFIVQDTSNILGTATDYRLFVAWKTIDAPPNGFGSYKVYRANSLDGTTCSGLTASSYTLLTTIATRTTNYYTDQPIINNQVYCYKVVSSDSLGNTSFSTTAIAAKSDGTQNYGEGGGGGSPATTPIISNVATSTPTPTSIMVSWDTDVLANSEVRYSTSPGVFTSSVSVATMVNNSSSVGNHQVSLIGLAPNTSYYFMVSSTNVNGLSSSSTCSQAGGCMFATTNGVTITGVANPEVTNQSAKIIWNTSGSANSYVIYSTSPTLSNPATSSLATFETSHSVTLTGLTSATRYYYYVQSATEGGITAQDKNVVNGTIEYYSFNTTNDSSAPLITNVRATPSTTTIDISWTTADDPSTSQVEYGLTTDYSVSTTLDTTLTVQHSQTLSNLTANTLYHYRMISRDANYNWTTSTDYTATTVGLPTVTTVTEVVSRIPEVKDTTAPTIREVKVTNLGPNSATISWRTDENGSSLVRYGLTQTYNKLSGQDSEYVSAHQVALVSITPATTYHFKAVSYDASGNGGESVDYNFTTLKEGETAVVEATTTPEVAEIEPKEDSLIAQIKAASEQRMAEILDALLKNPNLTTLSEDVFTKAFTEMTDKVVKAPTIVGTKPVVEVQGTTANVKWATDKKSDSTVFFAKDKDYKPDTSDPYTSAATTPQEFSTLHSVELANLEPAMVYHFQVKSKGLVGPEAKSSDYMFRTGSEMPKIFDLSISNARESSVIVNWRTNIPTAATIEYTNTKDGKTLTQGDATLLLIHNFILKNLESGSSYTLKVKVRDEFGNEESSPVLRFSTTVDTAGPLITKVSSGSTLYPGKESRVQTIISWETDEPATSQIFFQEGVASSTALTALPLDSTLTTRHIYVVTKFKPGAVYKFFAESRDPSGNTSRSAAYTILTPQETETIIDIMINNFEQVFGWTKKIGF